MEPAVADWKVVVVDDNPGDRRLYRLYLEQSLDQTYKIWEAETAEEGLKLCDLVRPDCVLLGYGLPRMTGLEMLEAIGSGQGDIPFAVLMLTGHRNSQLVADSLRHGAQDYLIKSITTPAHLERAVQNAIQKFALERQKKEAEQALRASEERFRNAFASAAIGMCVADMDGKLIEVNHAYCTIAGYPAEELVGRRFTEFTHPEDIPANLEEQRRIFSGETTSYVIEKRYIRKTGDAVWVRNSVSVVKDRNGAPIHAICLSEDISARHRLEEQLRQAHKMEAIGRLAAGVAHDFNNLLTVVIGYADLAVSQLADRPALRSEVEEIRNAGQRGASLVEQLLAFSRQQLLRPEVVDLNDIIDGLQKLLRRLIGADIDLIVQQHDKPCCVKTDKTQIEQVLINLAANARDAMPHGGSLRIEAKPVEVGSPYPAGPDLAPGTYILLTVTDTGHGMDSATLSHIFEPFFTTKGRSQGTGLGLATVYGIVKQSGGTVTVLSEPGGGTTFKVYLPSTREAVEPVAPPTIAAVPKRSATILLVEDDLAVRGFMKGILSDEGFTVLDCDAAAEALRLAGSVAIDLLLTDVVLPDMSGPELVAKLRESGPRTKVLYMSGHTDNALFRKDAITNGGSFLQKPFTRHAVLQKIGELLSRN